MAQAGKPIYLIANWKSNKTWAETEVWLGQFRGFREEGRVINVVCPPMPHLKAAAETVKALNLPVKLGVQDVSPFPFGAYTGAVPAQMVATLAKYAILGHSERRRYFHETDQEVANKVAETLESEMTPIVCVDKPYLKSQLNALTTNQMKQLMIAYEPLAAIGSGEPETPEAAQEVAIEIGEIAKMKVPVLFGGSVDPENVASYLEKEMVQGVLVGGASLKFESWKAIVQQAAKV